MMIYLKSIFVAVFTLLNFMASALAVEMMHFDSAPPEGNSTQMSEPLWGHFSKPDGAGPFPAVVLMHGCAGIHENNMDWAKLLNEQGYATLVVDSFRPRDLLSVCKSPSWKASPTRRVFDAYGALAHLQKLSIIQTDNIALFGWSHGGNAALNAVNVNGISKRYSNRFKAVVALYPYCIATREYNLPLLILMGEADDWLPVDQCKELYQRNQKLRNPVKLVTYDGVYHAFDSAALKRGFKIKGASGRMHWLIYNKKAHEDAIKQVKSFLAEFLS